MPAQAERIPVAAHLVSTVADDITQTAYWSWDRMFTMTRAEREDYQLRAARRRFDELAPSSRSRRFTNASARGRTCITASRATLPQ